MIPSEAVKAGAAVLADPDVRPYVAGVLSTGEAQSQDYARRKTAEAVLWAAHRHVRADLLIELASKWRDGAVGPVAGASGKAVSYAIAVELERQAREELAMAGRSDERP